MRNMPKVDPDAARRVVAAAARAAEIDMASIYGHRRTPHIVHARHVAQYLILKRVTGATMGAVGRYFGMDHTSVRNAVLQVQADIDRQGPRAALLVAAAHLLETERQIDPKPSSLTNPKPVQSRPSQPSVGGYIDRTGAIICAP